MQPGAPLSNWKHSLQTYLRDGDEQNLKSALRQEWVNIYPEDKSDLYRFLIHCDLRKMFLYFFSFDLQSHSQELPWLELFELLIQTKTEIPNEQFQELKEILIKLKFIKAEHNTHQQIFESLKSKRRYSYLQKAMKKKQELLASARIAESEGLTQQHVQYMNELRKISPTEFNVANLISEQQKIHAESVLLRTKRRRGQKRSQQKEHLLPEESAVVEKIKSQAVQYNQSGKARPSDFAYLLRSMGEKNQAVDFIYDKDDSEKKDWELLDYLFYGRQHLSLLDHCSLLKQKYSGRPDALFSVSYVEAIAYWELGEKEKAIHLMSQISSMRPNFKSASELLSQWKEESFE